MSKRFITRVFIANSTFSKNDRIPTSWPNLAHPINHAFRRVRHRLVPFRQKFIQNRKVLPWPPRRFRVGLNIDDVGWRVPGKILLESVPGAGQNPATGIQTWDASPENMARKRKRLDVTRGRTPVGL